MDQSEYLAEKQRRLVRALMHWELMTDEYGNVGFSKWGEKPLPHYYLYRGYFFLLIADTPAYELLHGLENEFYGDGIDLDYIEGLLLYYEEVGVLSNPKTIVLSDITGIVGVLGREIEANQAVKQSGVNVLVINKEADLGARFKVVRKWVKRKRASVGFVEVYQSPHEADPEADKPQPINRNEAEWKSFLFPRIEFPLTSLDNLLLNIEFIYDVETRQPTQSFKGSAVVGAIKALRRKGIMVSHDNGPIARVLNKRYHGAANINTVGRSYGEGELTEQAQRAYHLALAYLGAQGYLDAF